MMETAQPKPLSALGVIYDEELAYTSKARLLITAQTPGYAEALARRIHDVGRGASVPFVSVAAVDLPIDQEMLRETCWKLLDAASGGTLFISDVDQMAATVQDLLPEVFEELQRANASWPAVRLVSGTSVSLLELVAAGRFSERLFYRLNTIHLTV